MANCITITKQVHYDKNYIKTDKKSVGGSVFYVLPTTIGKVIITNEVTEEQVDEILKR